MDLADSGDVDLHADAVQLRHVLVNLLDNAIKYPPTGGRVAVSLSREDDCAVVTVEYRGIGIPSDDLSNIFDKFFRAEHPDVHKGQGTGLGLAIVKGIVDSHRGRIEVESVLGEGSTFRLQLLLSAS